MGSEVYYSPFIPTFSGNGLPVANARLYFFYTGTTDLAPIYEDSAMTIPMDNPVISNGAARYDNIYLDDAITYRVRETSADGTPLASDIDPYYPGQAVIVVPDLAEFAAPDGASLVGWKQQGVGTVNRTVETKLFEIISVQDFGAVGDGVADDTAAFQLAIDSVPAGALSRVSIYIPPGIYKITDTLTIDRDFVTIFGAGPKSELYFVPASSGKVMLLFQNADPAEIIKYISLYDFSFRAFADATKAKTGIKIIDGSQISIRNVRMTDYSWTNTARTSIGLHMAGRDLHDIIDCYFVADMPIYASTNPNSTTWQFDYHNFIGTTVQTLTPGATPGTGYGITFGAGVNPTSWNVIGCAAVSGNGGIYLNNEGTVVPGTPSLISIKQFRCEGGTANGVGLGGAYGIFMDFGTGNPACGSIHIEDSAVNDPTCHGFHFNGVTSLVMTDVNCGFAASNNALILTNVGQAQFQNLGIGHASAVVTLTNMYAQVVHKASFGASPTSKSLAFAIYSYYASDVPTNNYVYKNGVRDWQRTQSLANSATITLPVIPVGGSMQVRVNCSAGGGIWNVTRTTSELIMGSTGFTDDGTGTVSVTSDGAGNNLLTNIAAGTIVFNVITEGT